MRASDDLEAARRDVAEPRERAELMRAKPGKTGDALHGHGESPALSGRVA